LEGLQTDLIDNPELQNCKCMDPTGNCMECTHHWSKHMHITYENEVIEVAMIDDNVKKMIDKKKIINKLSKRP
jgi:hypothetical protein